MSIYKNDIQGDANISRNANIGSHANINGDVTVGHNLVVKGWVDAPNIKGTCKGLYASEEALKAAYPRPMPGWYALVGNTLPAAVWRVDGGEWTPTGETGGQFNIWLDQLETDVKDLTDDVRDLEELLDNGLLLAESITFNSTGEAASMDFTVMKRDGSTKSYSKPIPIVTAEKAGMMSAADKQELSAATAAIVGINKKIATLEETTKKLREDLDAEITNREQADSKLQGKLDSEISERKQADTDLQGSIDQSAQDITALVGQEAQTRKENDEAQQTLIDKLRSDFDALVGENASEAIDNFTEVLAFLDGLKDTEKLSTKLADLNNADRKLGEDVLELQNTVFPLTVTFDATPLIVKAGVQSIVSFTWKAERRKKDVTAEAEITLDGTEVNGTTSALTPVTLAHGATKVFTLSASFEGLTESVSRTVRGTHPTYFGCVAKTWTADEASIKALAELIVGSRSLTRTGIATADGRIALAYPKDFGALTSVKDGNGYEVLASYTRSEVSVNGIQYYCYLLSVPVTASGVTQIYK